MQCWFWPSASDFVPCEISLDFLNLLIMCLSLWDTKSLCSFRLGNHYPSLLLRDSAFQNVPYIPSNVTNLSPAILNSIRFMLLPSGMLLWWYLVILHSLSSFLEELWNYVSRNSLGSTGSTLKLCTHRVEHLIEFESQLWVWLSTIMKTG